MGRRFRVTGSAGRASGCASTAISTGKTDGRSAANDDEQISFTYTPIGLEATKTIAKAKGSGGWTNEQQVSATYFANSLFKTLTTSDGGSPANTLAQHTLSYLSSSIYLNGNRASDVFQLKGPDNTAACYSTTCTASWSYDARDRLTQEINGSGTTTAYTLNIYGDITQETQNGSTTRTATYSGLQLTTDTVSGTTKKYLYDSLGNLNCVVTNAWAGSTCPSITGSIDPSLITYNSFDTKNRLTATYTYSSGTLTDSATYTLDALDRTLSETETHSGTTTRTDTTYIGLSNATSHEQLYNNSGTLTETKSYVYDANSRRDTLSDNIAGGATNRYSYAYDPHGSVELLIDQSRTTKAAYGYAAYGSTNLSLTKTAAGFSANTNVYRYSGQRFDTGSSTIDYSARRYSPSIERFVQRDSYFAALDDLGLSSDPLNGNRYVLTGANPINFVEYDGHRPSVESGEFAVWQYNGSTLLTYGTQGGAGTTANQTAVESAQAVITTILADPKLDDAKLRAPSIHDLDDANKWWTRNPVALEGYLNQTCGTERTICWSPWERYLTTGTYVFPQRDASVWDIITLATLPFAGYSVFEVGAIAAASADFVRTYQLGRVGLTARFAAKSGVNVKKAADITRTAYEYAQAGGAGKPGLLKTLDAFRGALKGAGLDFSSLMKLRQGLGMPERGGEWAGWPK